MHFRQEDQTNGGVPVSAHHIRGFMMSIHDVHVFHYW